MWNGEGLQMKHRQGRKEEEMVRGRETEEESGLDMQTSVQLRL